MVSNLYRPAKPIAQFSTSSWMLAIAIALTCFSYPLTTVVLKVVGTNVSTFNILIKALTAALFMLVFIARRNSLTVSPSISAPLLIFLLIYSVRLIYDIFYLDIRQGGSSPFYTTSYFFLLTFVPVFVMALVLKMEDIHRTALVCYWTLVFACLVVAAYTLFGGEIDSSEVFSGRVQIEGEIEGTALLGPIHIGLVGASLAAMAMGRLAFVPNLTFSARAVQLGLVALGLMNVLFAGSRGPLVGIFLAIVFLAASYFLPRMNASRTSTFAGVLLLLGPLVLIYYLSNIDHESVYLLERVSSFFTDRAAGATEERDFIYQAAWLDFLDYPVFGRSMVVSLTGFGAHNLALEVLMATGVFGGAFFAVATMILFASFSRVLRGAAGSDAACLLLACVPIFVLSLTSGSIAEGPSLWVAFGLYSVIGARFCFFRARQAVRMPSDQFRAAKATNY
jgi:O-Antigen ligase